MPDCSDCYDESEGPCKICHKEYCDGCYEDHDCKPMIGKRLRA